MEDKIALLGMTLAELKAVAGEIGMPSFAARQMAEWLYGKKVASIDEMTNISAKNRRLLNERYTVGCAAPVDGQRSADCEVSVPYGGGRICGDGVYPRWRPGYALRVFSGGVQDELPFLHDRKTGLFRTIDGSRYPEPTVFVAGTRNPDQCGIYGTGRTVGQFG